MGTIFHDTSVRTEKSCIAYMTRESTLPPTPHPRHPCHVLRYMKYGSCIEAKVPVRKCPLH